MISVTITSSVPTEGDAGCQPKPEPRVASDPESKPGERSASSDPAEQLEAAEIQAFPYFEVYKYGYLY